MSAPTIGKSTLSYQAWLSQVEAFFVLRSIDDKDKLKVLPACLEEEILIRIQPYLQLGTTTFSSAVEKVKKIWMELRRPLNPEKMFADLFYSQPSEAAEALTQLQWLAEYLGYDSSIVKKRFISSSPEHLQPILFSKSSEKVESLVDFVLQCPDSSTRVAAVFSKDRASDIPARKGNLKCKFCGRLNHSFDNCRRRLRLCLRCGSPGHFVSQCGVTMSKNE